MNLDQERDRFEQPVNGDLIPQDSLFVCGQMGAHVTRVYTEPQPVPQGEPPLADVIKRLKTLNEYADKDELPSLIQRRLPPTFVKPPSGCGNKACGKTDASGTVHDCDYPRCMGGSAT